MIKDLTKGNSLKLIVLFSIPLLIGNLFQQLYNIADAIIVGRTIGLHALAAVGCTGSLTFLIVGYVFGFTAGMAIVTAQRFGAGDMAGVRKSFLANLILGLGMTIVLTLLGVFFMRPLLVLMRTPPEILDDAHRFISIIMYGIGTMVLFNVLSNNLRAVGNSRAPLVFLAIACVVNIILVYLFICAFGMGVGGAALATILAQLLSGLLCLPYILNKNSVFRLSRSDFSLTKAELLAPLRIGFPMGFQTSIIAIGAIIVQFVLNDLGMVAVAAYTAAHRIDIIATMPLVSFGITMATYTAQNFGAREYRRIRRGVLQCIAISITYSLLVGVTNVMFGRYFASFFIASNDKALDLARQFLVISGSCYSVLGLLFIFRNTLQGLGQSVMPTIAGILELLMRTLAAFVLAYHLGFLGVCLAGPLAWVGACVPLSIAFAVSIRRLIGKTQTPPIERSIPASQPQLIAVTKVGTPHFSIPESATTSTSKDMSCTV